MFIKKDKRKPLKASDVKVTAFEMKDIGMLETDGDVVEWCRDFFAATNAVCPQYERETRAERNYLMALVALLNDWFPEKDCTLDSLLTLLSMTESRAYDESYVSPLDILFKNIETGEHPVPSVDDDGLCYVPSKFKRNSDGVMPAKCGGLSAHEDFALLCYHSVMYLPANQRIAIAANLTSRAIDLIYLHGSPRDHSGSRPTGIPVD